ncbi:MAG: hypothetical protein Q8N36_04110 [bacterium]|nr:hypothetical protein [bacterium]
MDKKKNAQYVELGLAELHLNRLATQVVSSKHQTSWRISPAPLLLSAPQTEALRHVGKTMLAFYRVADSLYYRSLAEKKLFFVAEYLEKGKSDTVIKLMRSERFRGALPFIMRPDLLWTESGFVATEFDSLPGGAGILAGMEQLYGELGFAVSDTAGAFISAVKSIHKNDLFLVVVSDESAAYRSEMTYLVSALNLSGVPAAIARPEEVQLREDGVLFRDQRVGTVYRFFELFDLESVPHGLELLRMAEKGKVQVFPTPKAHLEEKMWFALLRYPQLRPYWEKEMGVNGYSSLLKLIPKSYILDPQPLPAHAVIGGLRQHGHEVNDFRDMLNLSRGERNFVIKPSGFSSAAWGSHGIALGKELSTKSWNDELDRALSSYSVSPHLLQEYHYSLIQEMEYMAHDTGDILSFRGKYRYCPYFFVDGKRSYSGGILITAVPVEKPLIHGMTDAVLCPAILA